MYVVLTKSDFESLTSEAKGEIAKIIGLDAVGVDASSDEHVKDLSVDEVKEFMSGVSDDTKQRLRIFVEHGGTTTVRKLKKIIGASFNWPGFQSGVTRRVRTVTKDPHALLFDWSDYENAPDDCDWEECSVSVSETTFASLKQYFSTSTNA